MDLMLLNAVHNTRSFPPEDAWLAGSELSYYHLGHVMVDVTGRLAATPASISFNLGAAAVGAMAAVAVVGLAIDVLALSAIRRRASVWIAGGLALVSFLWLAPFEGFAEVASANGFGGQDVWGGLGVDGLPGPEGATHGVPDGWWWWWHATRILPGTITEFPAFSLILGDLHAHLLALPIGVVTLALAVETFDGGRALSWRRWLREPGALLIAGSLFAGLVMTNSWDIATYGAIWFLAAAAAFIAVGWPWWGAAFAAARYLAVPAAVALAIAAPMLASFETPNRGIELVVDTGSDPARLAVFWGPLAAPLLLAGALLAPVAARDVALRALGVAALPIAVWAALVVASGDAAALEARGEGWLVLAGLVGAIAYCAIWADAARRAGDRGRAAWLAMIAAGALVVLATELLYMPDSQGTGRMNAVFKFWYAVWPLLAAAGGAGVAMAFDRARLPERIVARLLPAAGFATLTLIWASGLVYAPAAAVSRAREGQPSGVDALAQLGRIDPATAQAVRWVGSHLAGRGTLLEAVGRDYGPGNAVSAATGVPTLLGWPGHQVQWRGESSVTGRQETVDRIYFEGATPGVQELAVSLGVTHVYLGGEERAQYGDDVAERFAAWPVVFEVPGVRIVQVPGTPQLSGILP
jgi:YYY domain-containing protein